MESEVLRRFYSVITEVIAHPRDVALLLYEEGVVAEGVLDEVTVPAKPSPEKKDAIMRAVRAAVRGDPKKLSVFITTLEKFSESAPVASRMRAHWSCEPCSEYPTLCRFTFNLLYSSTRET